MFYLTTMRYRIKIHPLISRNEFQLVAISSRPTSLFAPLLTYWCKLWSPNRLYSLHRIHRARSIRTRAPPCLSQAIQTWNKKIEESKSELEIQVLGIYGPTILAKEILEMTKRRPKQIIGGGNDKTWVSAIYRKDCRLEVDKSACNQHRIARKIFMVTYGAFWLKSVCPYRDFLVCCKQRSRELDFSTPFWVVCMSPRLLPTVSFVYHVCRNILRQDPRLCQDC